MPGIDETLQPILAQVIRRKCAEPAFALACQAAPETRGPVTGAMRMMDVI